MVESEASVELELDAESKYTVRDLVLTVFNVRSGGELPEARCGHSLTALNGGSALLYGGASETQVLSDCFIFHVGSTSWERVSASGFSCPGPLFGHAAALVDRVVYIFGGLTLTRLYEFAADDEKGVSQLLRSGAGDYAASHRRLSAGREDAEEATNTLYAFDPVTSQWAEPHVVGASPEARFMHSACAVGRKVIFIGGCSRPGYKGARGDVCVLDLDKGEWLYPKTAGDAPSPRFGHSATHIGDGVVLLFGGGVEADDPVAAGAAAAAASAAPASGGAAANGGGAGKARGGGALDGSAPVRFNDVFLLDTKTWRWSRPQYEGNAPAPRMFHSAAMVEGRGRTLAIFGGETGRASSDMWVLDLERKRWMRPLSDSTFDCELQGAAALSGKMLVFGGLRSSKSALSSDFFFLNAVSIDTAQENEFTFKIVLAGNAEVGKSCLMTRFVEDRFSEVHVSTIGVDFKTVTTLVDGRLVKLHIWDTAGQERFAQVTAHYYRGADAAVLVYDTTDKRSFENVVHWVDAIESANGYDHDVLKLLVGNKCDLWRLRAVSTQQGEELARKLEAPLVETSAKDSTNVDLAFLNLARRLVEARKKNRPAPSLLGRISVGSPAAKDSKCC
jgi:Ras-related protein Rab-1A